MTPRTLTAPPTDRGYWRRLLRLVHPDGGGDDDLFVWVSALREHVAGDRVDPPTAADYHRPRRTTNADSPRVDFPAAHDKAPCFDDLTRGALDLADTVGEPYRGVLTALRDCHAVGENAGLIYRQQWTGATDKSLAAIGHRAGMSKQQRVQWYRMCEDIPLSQRHAGHILTRLQERAA